MIDNQEIIDDYLGVLNITTIDEFRLLFYSASDQQLDLISLKYEKASGLNREWIQDEGVQSNMVRWLGEELILISLYHAFEIKMKEIIRYNETVGDGTPESNLSLHRWDELKSYLPDEIKRASDFQSINVLRILVNCFKHAGVVSEELHRIDSSFGNPGDEITHEFGGLYEKYKKCASGVIGQFYAEVKLNKAKHNRAMQKTHCTGQPTLRFGCLCWRR